MTMTLVNLKKQDVLFVATGQLVVMTKLIKLTDVKFSLDPLVHKGVTCLPWSSLDDPIREIDGPIIDVKCKHVTRMS
jgi:hypothetical protein